MKNQNERECLMQNVREAAFALIDIGLYLDSHPEDEQALDYYNKYQEINKEVRREYEKNFGGPGYAAHGPGKGVVINVDV